MEEGREVVLMTRLRRQYNREYREYNSKKEKSYIWDVASYDHRLTLPLSDGRGQRKQTEEKKRQEKETRKEKGERKKQRTSTSSTNA
jgi:hypothetical protein